MDTVNLRTFLALSEILNFTQTAQRLFVAQSTVTNRIRELEQELGVKLFSRHKKQIELTAQGEKFRSYARQMVELAEASRRELAASTEYAQTVRLGCTNMLYACHLEEKLLAVLKTNPPIALEVHLGKTGDLLQNLKAGTVDAVFSFSPLHQKEFCCRPYKTDELILVCAYEDRCFAEGIHREELAGLRYLYCNFSLAGMGFYLQELFPPKHVFPFAIDNSTKLVQYAAQGLGYTFLPRALVQGELKQHRLREIPLLDIPSPFVSSYYITRSPAPLPEELEKALIL